MPFVLSNFIVIDGHMYLYCDEMPESRNSGIGPEVDFLRNELLRQLHDNS
jgi:hypothetical protein